MRGSAFLPGAGGIHAVVCCAVALLASGSHGADALGPRGATVSGVVVDADGLPIEGATVVLCEWEESADAKLEGAQAGREAPAGGPAARPQRAAEIARLARQILGSRARTATERNGRFTFHGVEGEACRLAAFGGAYAPGLGPVLAVAENAAVDTVLTLAPGAKLAGRVVDARGFAVANAAVRARGSGGVEGAPGAAAPPDEALRVALAAAPEDVLTGADGRFAFSAAAPAFYDLVAVKEGHARAAAFDVEAPCDDLLLTLPPGAVLHGEVTDEKGARLAGAEITLAFEDARDALRSSLAVYQRPERFATRWGGETDARGAFAIENLREGTYTAIVGREDFVTAVFPGVRVAAAMRAPERFELARGLPLAGKILGPDRTPVAGAAVTLTARIKPRDGAVVPRIETTSDDRGFFRLTTLYPETYTLQVAGDGFAPLVRRVAPGTTPLELVLARGAMLAVEVRGEGGPLAEAFVSLRPGDAASEKSKGFPGAVRPRSARADDRGRLAFAGLPEGAYVLSAEAAGRLPGDRRITLVPGEHAAVTVVLGKAGVVRGKVRGADGEPIAGASLALAGNREAGGAAFGGRRAVLSAADGAWELPLRSAAAAARVRATHPDYLPAASAAFTVGDPARDGPSLDIVMMPGAVLKGTVVGPDGGKLAGIRVQARQGWREDGGPAARDGSRARQRVTDREGAWRIGGLEAGRCLVWIDQAPYAPYRAEAALAAGEVKDLAIALRAEARMRGKLVNARGEPVVGAAVAVAGAGLRRRVFSDQEGRFEAGGLSPGAGCAIEVRAEGYLPFRERAAVVSNEALVCTLVLPGELSGFVRGLPGRAPVRPVRMTLSGGRDAGARPQAPRVFDAADGAFLLEAVAPGVYDLRVESEAFPEFVLRGLRVGEGARVAGIDIVLEPGVEVRGTVRSPAGAPVEGARVRAAPARDADREMGAERGSGREHRRGAEGFDFLAAGQGVSDKDGAFTLRGIAPGEYTIEAHHDGYAAARSPALAVREDAPPEPVALQLAKGLALSGSVVLPDGARAAGAVVALSGPEKQARARTDGEGRFRFEGLVPGAYTLQALAGRGIRSAPLAVILADRDQEVVLRSWGSD
ncbi:MAG TPA: carboxypeptidase-like regulatory domain-containing protein [Planctomycetota bacterium]|jgi:hypothetical protein|nr:carboxypeptidase regulatory-like domain-containing protein [Planctomycetota bacterium]OQC22264.1 MAG: Dioxygenase [Planctomycetes bacterium ADurb.Bin069]HNS00147.1 carboxypeptidase-like regulatory domain-containing protein [Planctomycetota bacterium]HNU25901.1 carboxypeptidase-like regulatory domain-containing protein [Planctomycetota bacterium]HOE29285.1 carboxypeptidase-like regulatory domain-containing protein [Planctomycetota bacterium]